jgi:hypothetical protein
MCPDRQLISVYLDGELPSPWKEKMESHLAGCPRCGRLLESYRHLSLSEPAPAHDNALAGARERVWHKLEKLGAGQAEPAEERGGRLKRGFPARRGLWGRSVQVPLPAAVAAVLLILAALLWAAQANKARPQPGMAFANDEYSIEAPGFDPRLSRIRDMDGVLEYLGGRDSGEILILRLPESRNFSSYGEPAIVKAADYPRRRR